MRQYEKPMVLANEELAEGVYAASGDIMAKNCDSQYIKGVWQGPHYGSPASVGYLYMYGCMGCPAYTSTGCGIGSHYLDAGEADSYDTDKGNRMPIWEKKGYGPNDVITDWL
jgi:hypothetical protein